MANGLHIILSDPQVKSVFVNVFGGITSCDAVANGIVGALDALGDEEDRPLVVRLDGNNVEEGRRILAGAQPPPRHHRRDHGRRGPPGRRARREPAESIEKEASTTAMSIFFNADSKVIVQGMTGSEGMKHTQRMLKSGTAIVGGVNPRKAGTTVDFEGGVSVPVYGTVAEAIEATGANVSVIFVPAAVHQGRGRRGDRRRDPARRRHHRGRRGQGHGGVLQLRQGQGHDPHRRPELPRPITPGVATPASSRPTSPAPAASASSRKSGTLTYQMMYELRDFGFSSAVGIGGDPIIGTTHIDCLEAFQNDPDTDAIVMIGEIGGDAEERAAAYIKDHVTKPVVGYVAGFTAPEGKTMGHAGAIVSGSLGHGAGQEGGPRGRRRQGRQDAVRDRRPHARDHAGHREVVCATSVSSGRSPPGGRPLSCPPRAYAVWRSGTMAWSGAPRSRALGVLSVDTGVGARSEARIL